MPKNAVRILSEIVNAKVKQKFSGDSINKQNENKKTPQQKYMENIECKNEMNKKYLN